MEGDQTTPRTHSGSATAAAHSDLRLCHFFSGKYILTCCKNIYDILGSRCSCALPACPASAIEFTACADSEGGGRDGGPDLSEKSQNYMVS